MANRNIFQMDQTELENQGIYRELQKYSNDAGLRRYDRISLTLFFEVPICYTRNPSKFNQDNPIKLV